VKAPPAGVIKPCRMHVKALYRDSGNPPSFLVAIRQQHGETLCETHGDDGVNHRISTAFST